MKKTNWYKPALFSVYKVAEGGLGYGCMVLLKEAKIPCRKSYSPFIGQVGIEVPQKFEKKATEVLYG